MLKKSKNANLYSSTNTPHTELPDPLSVFPAECEKQQADLVFLLDQSGSIHSDDYTIMKNFTTNLVRSFNISQDKVRVGLAQFASTFQHEFYLNQLPTENKVGMNRF